MGLLGQVRGSLTIKKENHREQKGASIFPRSGQSAKNETRRDREKQRALARAELGYAQGCGLRWVDLVPAQQTFKNTSTPTSPEDGSGSGYCFVRQFIHLHRRRKARDFQPTTAS